MTDDHDILIGMHLHDDNAAGLEVACSCGDLLFVECSLDGLLSLSEVTDIADRHRNQEKHEHQRFLILVLRDRPHRGPGDRVHRAEADPRHLLGVVAGAGPAVGPRRDGGAGRGGHVPHRKYRVPPGGRVLAAAQDLPEVNWEKSRAAALARDEGLCRRCSRPASHVHHRLRKGMGGELDENIKYGLANLVSLCAECHRHIHDHPAESYEAGWLLHTWQSPEGNPPPEMRTYEF